MTYNKQQAFAMLNLFDSCRIPSHIAADIVSDQAYEYMEDCEEGRYNLDSEMEALEYFETLAIPCGLLWKFQYEGLL